MDASSTLEFNMEMQKLIWKQDKANMFDELSAMEELELTG